MEQILWSDPRDIDGWEMSDRGKWWSQFLICNNRYVESNFL